MIAARHSVVAVVDDDDFVVEVVVVVSGDTKATRFEPGIEVEVEADS